MDKRGIDYYISSKCLHSLNKSLGAQKLIAKKDLLQTALDIVENNERKIASAQLELQQKEKELDELSKVGMLKKVFLLSRLKAQKTQLNEEIKKLKLQIEVAQMAIATFQPQVIRYQAEIDEFVKELAQYGFSPDDIIKAYDRALVDIELRQDPHYHGETNESEKEQVKPPVRKQQNMKGNAPKTAMDKFNARMQKHKEIISQRQPGQE